MGIERNIKGNEPAVFRPFNEEEVHLPRRRDEGEKPLFAREEFVGPEEEYTERRVVKVCTAVIIYLLGEWRQGT